MRHLLFLLGVICLMSCGEEKKTSPFYKEYTEVLENPSQTALADYYTKVNDYLKEHRVDKVGVKEVLEEATDVSLKQKRYSQAAGYLMPLIKNFPNHKDGTDVLTLTDLMSKMNRDHVVAILYAAYDSQYGSPKDENLSKVRDNILGGKDIEVHMDSLFKSVVVDPDPNLGLNKQSALRYVDAAEAYALVNPRGEHTPEYLYNAAEIARSIRTLPKALSIYDWILEQYPDFSKLPNILFLKGFILENDVKDLDGARELYERFVRDYPNHELRKSIDFLLDNLGKSEEEILNKIASEKETGNNR